MDIIDEAQERDQKINEALLAEVRHRNELNSMLFGEEAMIVDGVHYCVSCGDEIPPTRIAANPKASRCVDCQSRIERK